MDFLHRGSESDDGNHNHHLHGPTMMLIIGLAAIGALLYAQFIFNPANAGDSFVYAIVIVAESIIIIQALIALWTILAGGFNPRDYAYHDAKLKLLIPSVKNHPDSPLQIRGRNVNIDVFVTVYGEPLDTIKKTLAAAKAMIGRHRTYVLDDGDSPQVEALARELGVIYIRRDSNEGAKAGNVNNALAQTKGNLFVIFDADFVPKSNFLIETVPFFVKPKIAFVQTPQTYGNLDTVIARGAAYMQDVFYKLIQPGKNRFNAAFCVGTNVIFRRSAIESIGGMHTKSKSEDIWTSLSLHEKGYQSVFINNRLAVGDAPETVGTYFKQQLRWATGGFEILLRHNFLRSPLSFDQKLQYISTAAYYLHGLAVVLLMTLPPLHIFFNLSPVNLAVTFSVWLVSYLGFYGLQIAVAFYSIGSFRFETIVIAMASFPIYLKALANVMLRRDVAWQATGNSQQRNDPLNFVTPQILLFIFLAFTSVVGFWKFYYTGTFALSLVWNLINTLIFAAFLGIVIKERRTAKIRKSSRLRFVRPRNSNKLALKAE